MGKPGIAGMGEDGDPRLTVLIKAAGKIHSRMLAGGSLAVWRDLPVRTVDLQVGRKRDTG
jgi:hypothetical protein